MKVTVLNKIATLSLIVLFGTSVSAQADEAYAKKTLKSMSEYVGGQTTLSFEYDSILDVTTVDGQVLGLASSGSVSLNRPDKIHSKRSGGFVDVESLFDGKTLTLFGKNLNIYAQIEVPGTIDHLIDELKNTYNRPLPAADLLLSSSYDELMHDVTDVKDLGSGVIGGVECDTFAFRTEEVDWQIWIAQGDRPYPCRFVITSKLIANAPQYSVQTRAWKTGADVAADDFQFKNSTDAEKVGLEDLKGMGDLPANFSKGETE